MSGPGGKACSACSETVEEGLELWGSWFCSKCFISQSGQLHRELRPEDIELLRRIGRELSGFLPPDLLEMVMLGYTKRVAGSIDPLELSRVLAEIQRLTAFACFRYVLNLLKTWQSTFDEFVESQEQEIRDKIKKLTDLE